MATVAVKEISPLDYGQCLRGGLGALVVRTFTWNARGMWFDSHPKLKLFSQDVQRIINLITIEETSEKNYVA